MDLSKVDNVLDRWIMAATVTLTRSVKEEMEAYRLYNVVPQLLTFIEQLTNIYVRFNRKRLKGGNGPTDTIHALGTLYHVLMTLCKVRRSLPPPLAPLQVNNRFLDLWVCGFWTSCLPNVSVSPKQALRSHLSQTPRRAYCWWSDRGLGSASDT